MRTILICAMLALLSGCCPNSTSREIPSASMRVVEYKEISGSLPSPTLYVWLVADSKRDLCFVIFNSSHHGVSSQKIDCAGVKPNAEKVNP